MHERDGGDTTRKFKVEMPKRKLGDKKGEKKKKETVKKGFFDKVKPGEELYGPEGSNEGVVPDGAGDPLGYLPKKLRSMCKVVDTNNMTAEQQEETMAQYAKTGTVESTPTPEEAANAQYWDAKKKANAAESGTATNNQQMGSAFKFPDAKKGAGTKSELSAPREGMNKTHAQVMADTFGSKKNLGGLDHLMENGGFENMDFDGFMDTIKDNDIDPGDFVESMRGLADIMLADEGGSSKIDADVRDLVEKVVHEEVERKGGTRTQYPKSNSNKPKTSKGDIWDANEVDEDNDPAVDKVISKVDELMAEQVEQNAFSVPKHSTRLIKGDDLDDDKLEVTVELPLLTSIGDVDLEVEGRILSLEVEGQYALDLELDHAVDEDEVQARFDKSAKKLVLLAPIKY